MLIKSLTDRIYENLLEVGEYRAKCELILLQSVLRDPDGLPEITKIVNPIDFTDTSLREAYALISLMSTNDEVISLANFLLAANRCGLIDRLGGSGKYAELSIEPQNPKLVPFYAKEVARLAAADRVLQAALNLAENVSEKNAKPIEAVKAFRSVAERHISSIGKRLIPVEEVICLIHDSNNESSTLNGTRISTGIPELDAMIVGFYTKNLTLLGGWFGKGKSCLGSQIVSHAVSKCKSSIIFSLEMTEVEFVQRVLSNVANVEMDAWSRTRSDAEQNSIAAYRDSQSKYKWWIDDNSSQSVESIRSICQLTKLRDGLDLVVIDNLQLISPSDTRLPKDQQAMKITQDLKKLAKELDIAIVLLCQLDTQAGRGRPTPTSWASSKAIAGDADIGLMLHSPDEAIMSKNRSIDDPCLPYEVIVAKNRSRGERGSIGVSFNGRYQRFTYDSNAISVIRRLDGAKRSGQYEDFEV